MNNQDRPRFGTGAMLELREVDYLYGTGTLALRVTAVEVDPAGYHRMEWVNVWGVQVGKHGETGSARVVTIRVSAIREALRPRDWLPPSYAAADLPRRRRPS